MEAFRQSAEGIPAPICPECNVEMVWLRSTLHAAIVSHVFTCKKCDRVAETETPVQAPKE